MLALLLTLLASTPTSEVNPFIGTAEYSVCHPGALCPRGLMSVLPFNVMGSDENRFDKERGWWSAPYENRNVYLTGFAHVAMSGVGCPELGSLLVMPTTDSLDVDYHHYGSLYTDEKATPGYYTCQLSKYNVKAEVSATLHTSVERYTFPKGKGHILLNLGEGLTNECGATMRFVNDCEVEGSKLLGTFCYFPQSVFPVYFVMRVSKVPAASGYWKKQRPLSEAEKAWDSDWGKYKLYTRYRRDISGDDIGAWFDFDCTQGEQVEVRMGVSFVSIANARENLEHETRPFDEAVRSARQQWDSLLSVIDVEGGTPDQRTIFYTALYHTLFHPNILQDVNGDYPMMESAENGHTTGRRYTVFSLWDTYRLVHPLLTLLYPDQQLDMIRTMVEMYREWGWLPKWELFGRETMEMEGDPAIPVIVDSWMKGLTDFDVETAYQAMVKSATQPGNVNLMRPDINGYLRLGYCPMESQYDNSVSHALEYSMADYALSRWAEALGKTDDARTFLSHALGYRHYYSPEYGTLRPILPDGTFYSPFDPAEGANFAPCPGFHEGTSWNYTFAVPFDVEGLSNLMGGDSAFVARLQHVFDGGFYNPCNEPDIVYAYLFSRFPGQEWRTQRLVSQLLRDNFHNQPVGLPGNDDTGTMSCWALFSMLGIYPDCPGEPYYTITTPVFDRVTLHLDRRYYPGDLVIEAHGQGDYIRSATLGGKRLKTLRVSHEELIHGGKLVITRSKRPCRQL